MLCVWHTNPAEESTAWLLPLKGSWYAQENRHVYQQFQQKVIIIIMRKYTKLLGFPGSSAKESTCNVGDPGLIPGSGRSAGEGIGQPLQHSQASPVAQLAKNLPALWGTWVRSLGWEDPLEKGTATHSSILVAKSGETFTFI